MHEMDKLLEIFHIEDCILAYWLCYKMQPALVIVVVTALTDNFKTILLQNIDIFYC